MNWIPITERMPDPNDHDRVLIYTAEHDFNGEQVFDIKTETLSECMYENPEDQPEICKYATHWAERPNLREQLAADKQQVAMFLAKYEDELSKPTSIIAIRRDDLLNLYKTMLKERE